MTQLAIGSLALDLTARTALIDGAPVKLTGKEYSIVELMALRVGEVVTKGDFFAYLYGDGDQPDAKILDVYICKVRRKLRLAAGGIDLIETVWGRGYRLP